MKADKILYHDNCWDGATAAYIASICCPKAELVPMQYGYDFDKVSQSFYNKSILVVDFSFKSHELLQLLIITEDILIIDHHKTAIDDLIANVPKHVLDKHTILDDSMSGAGLVYDYFAPELPDYNISVGSLKKFVEKVQNRDLWISNSKHFEEFNAFMGLFKKTPESVKHIVASFSMDKMIEAGKHVMSYRDILINDHIKHVRFTMVSSKSGDVSYPAVIFACSVSSLVSDICSRILNSYQNDSVMCAIKVAVAVVRISPNECLYQLRSVGDADVSHIAKSFGGGGHKNSAGVMDSGSNINWYNSSLDSYK